MQDALLPIIVRRICCQLGFSCWPTIANVEVEVAAQRTTALSEKSLNHTASVIDSFSLPTHPVPLTFLSVQHWFVRKLHPLLNPLVGVYQVCSGILER